jgi:transcriptional regulator with XRE-family HTH domain
MSGASPELHESLCQRFMLVQEASGLSKIQFARMVGMSPQQYSNVRAYRTAPSHEAILRACEQFGLTSDWFYFGRFSSTNRNPKMTRMLQAATGQSTVPASAAG